jgi:hypothetical protein
MTHSGTNTKILQNWKETDILQLCTRKAVCARACVCACVCARALDIYALKVGHCSAQTESVVIKSTHTELVKLLAAYYIHSSSKKYLYKLWRDTP